MPPYIIVGQNGKSLSGSDVALAKVLSQKMGFTIDWRLEPSWIATMVSVQNGTSYFGIGHIGTEHSLYQMTDFSASPYTLEISLVMPKPKPVLGPAILWKGLR